VKRLLGGAVLGIGLTGIVLAVVHAAAPGRGALELDVFVLVAGGFAILTAVFATRQAFPPAEGSALAEALEREEREPERPPDLERTERLVTLASTTAFDLHYRLRPVLREIAEQRLADRRGLRLDAGGAQVEQTLGKELWEIVRPDRVPPHRRFEPGASPETLASVVEHLESIT
jgi:hypothetical protein